MKRIAGLDWPLLALAGCLLALSAAGATGFTHFDEPNIGIVLLLQAVPYAIATRLAWLVPFVCFYPVVGVIYLTCACSYLYFAHWPPTLSEGLPIYVPCILILIAEFALRRRRKSEEAHADPVIA